MNIGISTGCFYEFDWNYDSKIKTIYELGVYGIEIGIHTEKDLMNFQISNSTVDILKHFKWKSLHSLKFAYANNTETRIILERLQEICKELEINSVALHPDVVIDFEVLNEFEIPFSIENMDIRKQSGFTLDEMLDLKKRYNFSFVIDLQHIWEHDNSMQLGYNMVKSLRDRISHFHISGSKPGILHESIFSSDNKESILTAIRTINTDKVMITEGLFHNGIEDAKKEIRLLQSL